MVSPFPFVILRGLSSEGPWVGTVRRHVPPLGRQGTAHIPDRPGPAQQVHCCCHTVPHPSPHVPHIAILITSNKDVQNDYSRTGTTLLLAPIMWWYLQTGWAWREDQRDSAQVFGEWEFARFLQDL